MVCASDQLGRTYISEQVGLAKSSPCGLSWTQPKKKVEARLGWLSPAHAS